MAQMRVDIDQRMADIALERQHIRWEPLKLAVAFMSAGAALMGAAVALPAVLLKHFL